MKQRKSKKKQTTQGIGIVIATALVIGNMIGSGVFLLPTALANLGSISILAWCFTSIGALLLALVFARLSIWIPKVGGPYAYCRAAFGDFVGFQVAYNYWISVWVGNAAIMVGLLGYLTVFWPQLAGDRGLAFTISMLIIWGLTLVNILGVRQAGILQLIFTILKIIPLIAIAAVGIFKINPQHFTEFNVSGESNLAAFSSAVMLTMWSFLGLESATVPAEAVNNPIKTIPRATVIGVIITALIYIFSTIAAFGAIDLMALKSSTAPFADAARVIFGPWAGWMVALGAVISCFGAMTGWILLQGQIPYAAAKDGLFPRVFARLTPNHTPAMGLIISSTFVMLLLLLTLRESLIEQFTDIVLLATMASLVMYFFTAMAELMLLIRVREHFNARRFIASAVIASLAGAYVYWAMAGSGMRTVYFGTLLFFSSVPVYVWMKWRVRVDDELDEQQDNLRHYIEE